MTYAAETIKTLRAYLKGQDPDLDDVELGIVGGPSHITTGTSYHLGADQLLMWKDPYSARTARDLAGLSNAASALDIDDDLDELRGLSVWLVQECRKSAPDTLDIREIIYSPDGVVVLRWDRERGVTSAPVSNSDLSHRTHTHISWYRDSEFRDKTAVFRRFFEGVGMAEIAQRDWDHLRWRVYDALVAGNETAAGPDDLAGKQAIFLPRAINKLLAAAAADETRDAATLAAIQALAAGGTSVDTALVLQRINDKAAETQALVEQRHQVEMAALEQEKAAEIAGLRAELDRLTAP